MNIKISPQAANAILALLADAEHLTMPKKASSALMRFRDDVKRRNLNSQRYEHVLPILRNVHRTFQSMAARTLRYSQITRWMRLLVLPAVIYYLFKLLPAKLHYAGRLEEVAKVLNDITTQTHKAVVVPKEVSKEDGDDNAKE